MATRKDRLGRDLAQRLVRFAVADSFVSAAFVLVLVWLYVADNGLSESAVTTWLLGAVVVFAAVQVLLLQRYGIISFDRKDRDHA